MYRKFAAVFIIMAGLALYSASSSRADRVVFNSGGSIEGIILSEKGEFVELDVGFGTITCTRDQIRSIERSTSEELFALREAWVRKRKDLEAHEEEFARERERRFDEYEKWTKEERERKQAEETALTEIPVRREADSQNLLVDALLDDKVRATLVLDTGASLIVLSKKVGEELGVDLGAVKNVAKLHLADNRTIDAKLTVLKSVRIQDIEVKDVVAAVPTEDVGPIGSKDGLLGMSFLSHFNLKIDLANMKMSLEKIQK